MAQRVEFDGVVHEFPDDFTPEEISAALSPPEPTGNAVGLDESMKGPYYGPNNPEPGLGRSGRLAAENTVSTANKVLGLPVDLATMAINAPAHLFNIPAKLLGYEGVQPPVQNPVGGSASLQRGTNAVAGAVMPGYAPVADTDKTPAERAIKSITEFAGEAATTGAGLARTAATRAAETAPRLGDSLLRLYAKRPGYAVGADTVAGAGSGAGAALAQEKAPDSPWLQFLGSILGGGAGAVSTRIGQGLYDGGRRIVSGVTGSGIPYDPQAPLAPIPNRVADKAAAVVQGSVNDIDQARGGLADTMRQFEAEGLPQPTAGLASDDIGLIGLEQSARRSNPTPFIAKDEALKSAAADSVADMRPDVAPADMRAPQEYAKGRRTDAIAAADRRVARNEDRLNTTQQAAETNQQQAQTLAGPVRAQGSDTAQAAASRQLDEQTSGALAQRTAEKNRQFEALPDDPIADADPVTEAARQIRTANNRLRPDEQMPTAFLERLDRLTREPAADPMAPMTGRTSEAAPRLTVAELADTRKYLNTAAEKAQRGSNYDMADSVRVLKQRINEAISAHPEAATANAYYTEQYAPFFATGRGRTYRDKVQRDPNGRQDLPPEKVADFWLNNTEDSAHHLARIIEIAPNPQAAQGAARNYLVGDLARSVVDADGRLNPVLMREWLDNNRGKLRAPELAPIYNEVEALQRQALNNRDQGNALSQQIRDLNRRVREVGKTRGDVERAIDNGMLGTLLRNDPVNAAKSVIAPGGDPLARAQQMNNLLRKAPPNSRARVQAAWEAAVVDAISEKISTSRYISGTDKAAISYAGLKKELDTNNEVLAEVFRGQPEKMQSLRRAQMALEPLLRKAQQATTGSPTAEALTQQKNAQQNMLMIEAGLKAYYGVLVGGSKFRTMKILGRAITGDDSADVARLVERAFTENPKLMQQLLDRTPRGPRPGYNKKVNTAIGAKEAYTEDEDRPGANQR